MSLIDNLSKVRKDPRKGIIKLITKIFLFNYLSDKYYLSLLYFIYFGRKLDFNNPQYFNEKLQFLKIKDRKEIYSTLVDKNLVKKYVSNLIGEKYIIPTIATYNTFNEIDFKKLPDKFVIKCTHDSGGIVICKNKKNLNIKKTKRKINRCLRRNFYYHYREWPYKNLKPMIIIEKYMEDFKTKELIDYKFLCFNGNPKIIEIHSNRFNKNYTQDFYDINWNKLDIYQGPSSDKVLTKPKNFDKMVQFSKILSKDMLHVRIDWYEINNKLYFGEITFYDGGGFDRFEADQYDLYLGNLLNLED